MHMQFFNVVIGQPYGNQESSEHLLNILSIEKE